MRAPKQSLSVVTLRVQSFFSAVVPSTRAMWRSLRTATVLLVGLQWADFHFQMPAIGSVPKDKK